MLEAADESTGSEPSASGVAVGGAGADKPLETLELARGIYHAASAVPLRPEAGSSGGEQQHLLLPEPSGDGRPLLG